MNTLQAEILRMENAFQNIVKMSNEPHIYNTQFGSIVESVRWNISKNIEVLKQHNNANGG